MEVSKNVEKILAKYEKAKRKRAKKDELWKVLDAYDRGEQWEIEGNMPSWIPKPVTNYIHLVKYTKRASLFMDNSAGKLRPVAPNDEHAVKELQLVYEFVWEKTDIKKVIRTAIETSKLLGTAIAHVYWNENTGVRGGTGGLYEGEIEIKDIDPACFYPDPNAFRLEDCEFVHIVERKPAEWVKKQFKNEQVEQAETGAENRGEIYHRDFSIEGDSNGIVDFHQHYEKVALPEGGFRYKVTYIAGDQELKVIDELQPRRYPFAVLYDFPQRMDFWGKSTCEFILDNQKVINRVESIATMIGTLLQNPQKVIAKSSGINPEEARKYGNSPGHVWVTNGDVSNSMKWQEPPQIPPALMNLLETAKGNVREVTGINQAYMGENVGSLQTSQGVNSLIERATMRDKDQLFDIEMFIRSLSELIIAFITTKYVEPRYLRIIGEGQDNYEFMKFIGSDYDLLEYDFFIDVSSKVPVSRMREQNEAKELLNMQGQYGYEVPVITPQEYMDISDFVHKDQLIKRMEQDAVTNKAQQSADLALQIMQMIQSGEIAPDQAQEAALTMIQEMDKQSGKKGYTSDSTTIHSSQFQKQQAGV